MITHSQLSHPNIIRLLGIAREYEGGPPMMVLPFVEHGSLEEHVKNARLEANVFAKIVRGLSY